MPFGSEGPESGTGLALSGGGFRATLFHCRAFWRLNELGYLQKLDRVSSVSGGSIAAGLLGLKWAKLRQSNWGKQILLDEIITPLRTFCEQSIDAPSILEGYFFPVSLLRTSSRKPTGSTFSRPQRCPVIRRDSSSIQQISRPALISDSQRLQGESARREERHPDGAHAAE